MSLTYYVEMHIGDLWWSPVVSASCGINLEGGMLDNILHGVDHNDIPR
jgi:hypothetical protein